MSSEKKGKREAPADEKKAAKKRGLSLEDKRSRMLDLFYERKDVFQLKELEKIAPKAKGIIFQSVKDVVKSLLDDSLIETDKIGTSTYYWSFPSKALAQRKSRIEELQEEIAKNKDRLKTVKAQIVKAKVGKEDSEDRQQKLAYIKELQARKAQLDKKIEERKDCDPETLKNRKTLCHVAKEAANRWTDNIFEIKKYLKNTLPGIDEETIDKQFEIVDMDYIE